MSACNLMHAPGLQICRSLIPDSDVAETTYGVLVVSRLLNQTHSDADIACMAWPSHTSLARTPAIVSTVVHVDNNPTVCACYRPSAAVRDHDEGEHR